MLKFLLVDDHAVIRKGLILILKEYFSFCNIDEAENEDQAIEKIKTQSYNLIFLDIHLGETNALSLLNFILSYNENNKVLMFSINGEKMYAKRFLEAGAKGYLTKEAPVDEIIRAINLILNNRTYYSDELMDNLVNEKSGKKKTNPFDILSKREFEVLNLLLEGKTVTEIARSLNIETSTTGTHKAKILKKLGVTTLFELFELAKIYK